MSIYLDTSRVVSLDVETTMVPNHSPYSNTSKLCRIGLIRQGKEARCLPGVYDKDVHKALLKMNVIVGFNLKFDLAWMRRAGYEGLSDIKLWDCQYAYYLLNSQATRMPKLDDALEDANIPLKIDKVKEEYWDKGIDTPDIPTPILDEYLTGDVEKTLALFHHQYPLIVEAGLLPVMELAMEDLHVLNEMEWNGMRFNVEGALEHADVLDKQHSALYAELIDHIGIPFNPASNDQLSAVLYGGTFQVETRVPNGVFKSGKKMGETRYKIERTDVTFPRRYKPIEGSESKKEGVWLVNTDVLAKLRPLDKKDRKIIPLLQQMSKLAKLSGTYLRGWSKLIDEMNWHPTHIHQTLNQCVTATGRLSSSKPNSQNADPITKKFIVSRFEDGVILDFDVKGLETMAAAYLSGDAVMIEEIKNGIDLHSRNQEAFGLPHRTIAKILVFRLLYGGTEHGFVLDSDFMSVSVSKKYWKRLLISSMRSTKV